MSKVMMSLSEELLAALDETAARADKSRSAVIREAVRAHLAHSALDERPVALESLRRSFRDARPVPETPEDWIRADRDR